jgi:hypothetical protein
MSPSSVSGGRHAIPARMAGIIPRPAPLAPAHAMAFSSLLGVRNPGAADCQAAVDARTRRVMVARRGRPAQLPITSLLAKNIPRISRVKAD